MGAPERPRRWYARRPAVRAEVECAGAHHRVTWRRGRIVMEDHDLLAERALHGLGAEKTSCVEVLEEWRAVHRRSALEELPLLLSSTRRRGDTNALPEPLRLVAGVAAVVRCERHWDDDDFPDNARRVVAGELNRCFEAALRDSVGFSRTHRTNLRVRARTEMVATGEPAWIAAEVFTARSEVRLAAGLPLRWLVEVWGRGIAAVDGHLVIDAAADRLGRLAALAVTWDTAVPQLVDVWLVPTDDGWSAHPADPPPRLLARPWWSVDRRT